MRQTNNGQTDQTDNLDIGHKNPVDDKKHILIFQIREEIWTIQLTLLVQFATHFQQSYTLVQQRSYTHYQYTYYICLP